MLTKYEIQDKYLCIHPGHEYCSCSSAVNVGDFNKEISVNCTVAYEVFLQML